MSTYSISWARGQSRRLPDGACYYDGDAPTYHPAFKDARLTGDTWHVICKGKAYAQDKIARLRSWGITATMTRV